VRGLAEAHAVDEFFNTVLLVYAGLFPIVNPIGGAPVFLGLTSSCTQTDRNSLARRVAFNSVLLLAGSLFIGSHVLVFFGITLPVVRIAGGLVLIAFGWKLLQSGADIEAERSENTGGPSSAMDSFYPLTMPLTVGPGSISVAIALGSQRPSGPIDLYQLALLAGAAIVGIVAVALTVYICYRYAEGIIAMLGKSGTNVVVRLSAFILLCIGIQILWTGYSTLTPPAIH
jgi:multiple antibiotic resistance protein